MNFETAIFLGSMLAWSCAWGSEAAVIKAKQSLQLEQSIQQAKDMPFVPHPNALAMNIPYEPMVKLRAQLEKKFHEKLIIYTGWDKNGEAHITTITPPEYKVLSPVLNLEKINEMARAHKIQSSDIQIVGLGRGEVQLNGKLATTFFVIIKSADLLNLRKAISKEFIKQGGKPEQFNAESFYPHITVAFTDRDLHESDGVIKDEKHSLDQKFKLELK